MYDLLLKAGRLTDEANGLCDEVCDIAIKNGRIEKIGKQIEGTSNHEVNLEEMTVTPGLIDFHAHFFSGGTNTSLEFSSYLPTGVTNAVDAGSAGVSNIDSFFKILSEREKRNCRFYLNLSSEGLSCLGDHNENINPKFFNAKKIREFYKQYPKQIVGLKLRISDEIARISQTTSFEALKSGIEIAESCGLPLSVHMPDFQGELKELIDILRPGDIFCHVFTPKKGIMEEGKISAEILRGQAKGIVMESACGKGHLGHKTAMAAMEKGLFPDIISGDFTRNTFTYKPAGTLPYLMSRFMAMGMEFSKVLACCTTYPAEKIGMTGEVGCLKEGAAANIAVFNRKKGDYIFTDVENIPIIGREILCPEATILEGEFVYNHLL